jgi:hypothetical protein
MSEYYDAVSKTLSYGEWLLPKDKKVSNNNNRDVCNNVAHRIPASSGYRGVPFPRYRYAGYRSDYRDYDHVDEVDDLQPNDRASDPRIVRLKVVEAPEKRCFYDVYTRAVCCADCVL